MNAKDAATIAKEVREKGTAAVYLQVMEAIKRRAGDGHTSCSVTVDGRFVAGLCSTLKGKGYQVGACVDRQELYRVDIYWSEA